MKKDKSSQKRISAPIADRNGLISESIFSIVGVGASAGGLEAFSQLLASIPADTGMAYVLVQHLDPHHKTILGDLLSKVSRLPIQEATQDLEVRPDHIYVIPPNMSMIIRDGLLRLTPRADAASPFLPVDIFLRSLANDRKEHSIGIILSGTGSDGTQGLEEIKAAGGITFAQDDDTSKFSGMPQSAIQTGCVDFILSPDEIGKELMRISQHPYMMTFQAKDELDASNDEYYNKILALLRSNAGVDFTAYRDTTIKRRILRRMVLNTKDSFPAYIDFIEKNPDEIKSLYNDLLINVTSFFREPDTFEALKANVFPELVKAKESSQVIRIWVPGCSSGQEAYSLAIVLLEFLSDKSVHATIQIFATDLSEEGALRKAREGLYPESIEAEVAPERLKRFFTKEGDKYRINKSIREMCIFAKHNVAVDPPFSHMDLISCRNLLIYLSLSLQRRVLPTFHYALNPSGFLLLGASESVGVFTDLFGVIDQNKRIYRKKIAVVREYPHFTTKGFPAISKTYNFPATVKPVDWQREADRIVLNKYAPAGVLVNSNLDILQFRGKTSPYLESPPGEPSHNLLRMAGEGLFATLRNAINEASKQSAAVSYKGMRIRKDEQMQEINIQVIPITLPNVNERCFLVLFEEARPTEKPAIPTDAISEIREASQLRQELGYLHEYMQSVTEEKDTINEELRATNEEFLSSNEELQSTNEELETAKEELQSVNEELTTVNEQLNQRNKELSQLNERFKEALDYSEAIIKTVRDPLVVLDSNLRVQTANPAFYKTFNVTPDETKNCLLYDIGNHQWDIPKLRSMLEGILPQRTTLTDFEVSQTFDIIGPKTMLLNATSMVKDSDEMPLVLLAIEDISERKMLEEKLAKSNQELSAVAHRKGEFIAMLSHELRNPLAPLYNAVQIIRMPNAKAEMISHAYEIIDNQLKYMEILIDDLLDISRIRSGKIHLRKERVQLKEIIKIATQSSQPLINASGHKLTVEIPDEPVWLDADPMRMSQVISNLLNNSAKYTPKNGLITLSVECKESNIIVHVKDNGIGLSAEMLPHIFDMFSQVETSIERTQGGMGVGLALVKNLVELHGGTVKAISAGIGKGSEFIIFLPISEADNTKQAKD